MSSHLGSRAGSLRILSVTEQVCWHFRPQNRRDSNGTHLYCINLLSCMNTWIFFPLYWFCTWLLCWLLICNIQSHYSVNNGNLTAFYTCNFLFSPFVWLLSLAEWEQPSWPSAGLWAAIYLLCTWQPFLVCCGFEFHIFLCFGETGICSSVSWSYGDDSSKSRQASCCHQSLTDCLKRPC